MRRDRWTKEENQMLVETALECIRTGRSLRIAFDNLKIKHSTASIKHRWFNTLKPKYKAEVEQAKLDRENGYVSPTVDNMLSEAPYVNNLKVYTWSKEYTHEYLLNKYGPSVAGIGGNNAN